MKAHLRKIEFTADTLLLDGRLHLPKIDNPPLVIGSHGLEGTKNSAKQQILAKLLPENGIAFLRFDHRGCGQSQGEFIKDTSLEKRAKDFICAVHHVLSLGLTQNNIGIFGSSLGGSTCIQAWNKLVKMDLNLCGAVFCSAPVKSLSIERIPVEATDKRGALPLSFFKNNLIFNIIDKTKALTNVLIFHGDNDEVVPVSNAYDIYDNIDSSKKLIIHKNGDHMMSLRKDQKEFETLAVQWFKKCFKISHP